MAICLATFAQERAHVPVSIIVQGGPCIALADDTEMSGATTSIGVRVGKHHVVMVQGQATKEIGGNGWFSLWSEPDLHAVQLGALYGLALSIPFWEVALSSGPALTWYNAITESAYEPSPNEWIRVSSTWEEQDRLTYGVVVDLSVLCTPFRGFAFGLNFTANLNPELPSVSASICTRGSIRRAQQ